MNAIKVLVVEPEGRPRLTEVVPDLEGLRALIGGGWLEGVGASIGSDWHAYADEEGRLKGMPVNATATALARTLGWPGDFLVGPVVFAGQDGTEEADVPQRILDMVGEGLDA